jgi:excisionase family DNA binding protein
LGYTALVTIEGWLTQEQAAEKLHIALDTMRRYVREGKFPRTKVGKRYLIPESAISEFLQKGLLTGPREVKPRKKAPASSAAKKRKG